MFGVVVKMLGTPIPHFGVLIFKSHFLLMCTLGAAIDGSRSCWVHEKLELNSQLLVSVWPSPGS